MISPARAPQVDSDPPATLRVSPGQRWINHARPELGLGMVIAAEGRTVTLRFGDEARDHIFALESAPLSRIRFSPGDVVRTESGARVAIDGVEECEGIFVYTGTDIDGSRTEVVETMIAANQSFNRPAERLLHGHIDDDRWFALRYRTLVERYRLQADPLFGLVGGRNALLPHQMYVASEVSARFAPRVLLADEVGLGKTIEAGLVAHCQLATERARRVLAVVPESLVHQWLVEMLRRFNLSFSVYDAERCDAIAPPEAGPGPDDDGDDVNPFLDSQLVLVSRAFLLAEPDRLRQCVDARWDLLIVDEAHHLDPDGEDGGAAYDAIGALSAASSGVLLLTGTPRRFGAAAHFARLRLLDPDRYHDPGVLEREHADFEPLAQLTEALLGDDTLSAAQQAALDERGVVDADATLDSRSARDRVIDRLLDRYGTGRVMFRNTRAATQGFPGRRVHLYALDTDPYRPARIGGRFADALQPERQTIADHGAMHWAQADPRVAWLEDWLRGRPREKALVICASAEVAAALAEALKHRSGIRCAVFHEGLSLVERDRAAAWFAESEDGCQALVCSEIGSEGRNFQFARHLVLFDLPPAPDLLEQRIGRLDRVGRAGDVQIHVPHLPGPHANLCRWYHEGLDAFEQVGDVNQHVYEALGESLPAAILDGGPALDALVARSRATRAALVEEMRAGRDRLLELHSCRPGRADELVEAAMQRDQDASVREYIERAGACYDIGLETYRGNSVLLTPGERLMTPIPGLPETGLAATFDRATALENEDLAFLTWEHPLVNAIADLVLNTERGNATVCGIRAPGLPRGRLAVECVFVIESPLFARPELARYSPPLLVTHVCDESGTRLDPALDHALIDARWVPLKPKAARQIVNLKRAVLRRMLDAAGEDISTRAGHLLRQHGQAGLDILEEELARLRHLRQVNPAVRAEEIDDWAARVEAVAAAIRQPRVRLDAVRTLVGL